MCMTVVVGKKLKQKVFFEDNKETRIRFTSILSTLYALKLNEGLNMVAININLNDEVHVAGQILRGKSNLI